MEPSDTGAAPADAKNVAFLDNWQAIMHLGCDGAVGAQAGVVVVCEELACEEVGSCA